MYNIGGDNEIQNINIVRQILDYLNKPHSLITYVKDRLGHYRRYVIDASKIKDDLGWKPKYEFKNMIKNTINWYLNNNEWIENVVSGDY